MSDALIDKRFVQTFTDGVNRTGPSVYLKFVEVGEDVEGIDVERLN